MEIDAEGIITLISPEKPPSWESSEIEELAGFVVPGAVNLHSHAHQRGLAGHAEGGSGDRNSQDFWQWRDRMYAFVLKLDPDAFSAVVAQSYLEMVRAGFTVVGEFHYLHNDVDGGYYADPFEMAARVLQAADYVGIGLTILPSLYMHGGIGRPPSPKQRRFVHRSVEDFLDLFAWLRSAAQKTALVRVGIAPHSLRAVGRDELETIDNTVSSDITRTPIHIHVAEQTREVDECVATLGKPPASWLLEHRDVGDHWTFIHATHCTSAELHAMAARGVIAGLCPLTEGNVADGYFPLSQFYAAGGMWGIGSDSNLVADPAQELRFLEYSQRLSAQRRNVLVAAGTEINEQPGRLLYDLALAGGAHSLAQPVGALEPGKRADLVELDPSHVALVGHVERTVFDGWMTVGSRDVVRNVMVGGRWVIRDGHHAHERAIEARFRKAMQELWR